jgi:hypothetical protein
MLTKGDDNLFGIPTKVPIDILFLKRGESVYLLLLTPRNSNPTIPSNLLYDIVTGK